MNLVSNFTNYSALLYNNLSYFYYRFFDYIKWTADCDFCVWSVERLMCELEKLNCGDNDLIHFRPGDIQSTGVQI